MSTSRARRRVFVRLPDTGVIRNTKPSNVVRERVDHGSGLGGIPLRDETVQYGVVTKPFVVRIGRVDVELVGKELIARGKHTLVGTITISIILDGPGGSGRRE